MELEEDADQLRSLGAARWGVTRFGAGLVDPETVVVGVEVDAALEASWAPDPSVRQARRARANRARGRADARPPSPGPA